MDNTSHSTVTTNVCIYTYINIDVQIIRQRISTPRAKAFAQIWNCLTAGSTANSSIHTYVPMYLQICCPETDFAAARQSACHGPGPVLPLVPPSRVQARACAEPCGNLNTVSLSTYVNVIAHACVPAYKHTLIHIKNTKRAIQKY